MGERERGIGRTIQLSLTACSGCLRVQRGEEWADAETVIRELRSFEYEAPPRFEPALCPSCSHATRPRGAQQRVAPGRSMVHPSGHR